MTSSALLLALVGVLAAAGFYLVLDRGLTRVLLGVLVLGNAVNLLLVGAGGPPGGPPLVGHGPPAASSDALVQALVLTALVITLGVAAFLLALIHRAWSLEREDDLSEDTADRSVRRRLARHEQAGEQEFDTAGCETAADADEGEAEPVPAAGTGTGTGDGDGDAAGGRAAADGPRR